MTASDVAKEERRKELEAYCKRHNILELTQDLVHDVLKAQPEGSLRRSFARSLREKLHLEVDHNVPSKLLHKLFEAAKRITSEIGPKDAIKAIIQETLNLLDCDAASLFVYNSRVDALVVDASNMDHPIRVKPGQGIAGHVFTTRTSINIPDCSQDARFDKSFDLKTGYSTKTLLAMPIVDFDGECLGVLQAINKKSGVTFGEIDEFLLENLTEHTAVCLRNVELYRSAITASDRASAVLKMVQELCQDLGLQSMILAVTTHATEIVKADRCTLFFVDEAKEQLWSVSTDSGKEIRIPFSMGIAGRCAKEGQLINVTDAYEDDRFNQEVDKQTGYRTRSILAVPVSPPGSTASRVFAVLQMVNKVDFDGETGVFTEDDVQALQTFAGFVASRLEGASTLSLSPGKRRSEGEMVFGGTGKVRSLSKQGTAKVEAVLEEEEEEEEEEAGAAPASSS